MMNKKITLGHDPLNHQIFVTFFITLFTLSVDNQTGTSTFFENLRQLKVTMKTKLYVFFPSLGNV